jgi:hypothetical protein
MTRWHGWTASGQGRLRAARATWGRERGEPSGEERGTCVGMIGKMNMGCFLGGGLTGGPHQATAAAGQLPPRVARSGHGRAS